MGQARLNDIREPRRYRPTTDGSLQTAGRQRFLERQWTGADLAIAAGQVLDMPDSAFDRYANPFEQKWALHDKARLPFELGGLVTMLEALSDPMSVVFGVPLFVDTERHYCGIFKYGQGDSLSVHVDAGLHPANGMRKHVTAVLYIEPLQKRERYFDRMAQVGGFLELWEGSTCTIHYPKLRRVLRRIAPTQGSLVVFENNDFAWHGVSTYNVEPPRIVITVSFLSYAVDQFKNQRKRAFFIPRPDEKWVAGDFALRDKRADPEHYSEAYRV